VAVGALPDGRPVTFSGGSDRTVRIWALDGHEPIAEPLDLGSSINEVCLFAGGWAAATDNGITVGRF